MNEQTADQHAVVDQHHVPRARGARAARRCHGVPLSADGRDLGLPGLAAPRRP